MQEKRIAAARRTSWLTALGLMLALVSAPVGSALAAAPATTHAAPAAVADDASPARPGATARQTQYAQREAASPRAADFKGNGVGIYIGGSTLAVVLVVVLIVVLL